MDKFIVSAAKILLIVFIVVNASAVWGEGVVTEAEVKEWYKRRGAELADCKGNRVCLDQVQTKHAQQRARARRELMAPPNFEKYKSKKGLPRDAGIVKSNRPKPPTGEKPGSSPSTLKTDEFDLGDLDF